MLEATKEIVTAMINQNQIANYADHNMNIIEVQKAIKEIYQALLNTKSLQVETK